MTDPDLLGENGAEERARRRAAFVPRPGSWTVAAGEAELLADADRPGAYLLAVDEVAQSYVDLIDPTHLEFGYVQAFALLVDVLGPPAPRPLDVVHVGGGAATLARWIAATRPESTQTVLENDAALVAGIEERLGTEGFSYRIADGRDGVADLPDAAVDAVVTDAFVGHQVPARLTTVEYLVEVRRVLRPHGWYALNVADSDPFGYVRRIAASVAEIFPSCALILEPSVLRGRRFGNVLVVGSAAPAAARAAGACAGRRRTAVPPVGRRGRLRRVPPRRRAAARRRRRQLAGATRRLLHPLTADANPVKGRSNVQFGILRAQLCHRTEEIP